MGKTAKIRPFLFLILLGLLGGLAYFSLTAEQGVLYFLKSKFFYGAIILAILIWAGGKIYRAVYLFNLNILEKYNNLERLLFDIRDGTKTYYKEKRRSRRAKAKEDVRAKILNRDTKELLEVLNISYDGMLVRLPEKVITEGDILGLNIYLPIFPQPIEASGRVVRVDRVCEENKETFDTGIEYLDITHTDREKLLETVDMLSSAGE